MDYSLENLGPERFQEVCHALLVNAFPKTQCFPVGQRDGGRDAISFYYEKDSDDFVVYQVKYVRKPLAERAPHEWLKEIVAEEAPKVSELILKGATQYFLLTNVPGTAYPESGSIDTVQRLLNENLSIPAQCWWRDDINRRLDHCWNLKWSYPEILSGPDILRYIIEKGLSEDAERRTSALRIYVRDQFDRDTEVRFKQVELQNKLLDLFIDVPIDLGTITTQRQTRGLDLAVIRTLAHQRRVVGQRSEETSIGIAELLLHPLAQEHVPRVVVEGAPGQGKSTITQYICQIHRHRILGVNVNDARIPESHRQVPIRLPFKIDCRDFALWLGKQNPFSADETEVPVDWQKSLESFLAAHVQHYSGGASFSVSDVHAVLKLSAILLVFDGLDEVADVGRRREVVDQITRGVNRLREIALSVQTVVTSRPAAFANSPGLPEDTFRYLSLASITRTLIDEYAEKWLRARKLDGKEASVVRKILRDKLDQPHLRELARNPMQLAILLSLVQTRGGSLPDKRTALYDSYVELFFNREAEKSSIVRDNRDLLVDIHRYLAWVLHAESQTKRNRGSVTAEQLRQLVVGYLESEGRDTALGQQLFTGMVERVVALVSRVEGTYEFEVQPLREYFAARHLYNTAPYSPPGNPQNGTLPERFDALCRDFYWLNVTRFYAGCYSKGELPSLVDRLDDLMRSPGYRDTGHPQSLAAILLADWVFAQHPRSMKQVVALILDGAGLRHIASGGSWHRRDDLLVLPKQSGNEELLDRCFELLAGNAPPDYAMMLIDLIRANATRDNITKRWLEGAQSTVGATRTKWTMHGLMLGILANLTTDQLLRLLDDECENAPRLAIIARGGQQAFVESDERRLRTVVDDTLDRTPELGFRRTASMLDAFIQTINPFRYSIAFRHRDPTSLAKLWEHAFSFREVPDESKTNERFEPGSLAELCQRFTESGRRISQRSANEWATQLSPWNELVESGRLLFGDRWAFYIIANASAGVRSKVEACDEATVLRDSSVPLCRRARYARLRAGASSWWESQLQGVKNQIESAFTLMVLFTWAGPTVFLKNFDLIDRHLCFLESDSWQKLNEVLQHQPHQFWRERRDLAIDPTAVPSRASARMIVALSARVNEKVSDTLFLRSLREYDGDERAILEFCQRSALRAAQANPETWENWLGLISRSYQRGAVPERYFAQRFAHAIREQAIPLQTAEKILHQCELYPTELVAQAEQALRQHVAELVVPVGTIAEKQNWFHL